MGRRKKEPASVHRTNISIAAEQLFAQKGIETTTVDNIAKLAGYSKATLYVYFKNKEEIVGLLVLESMKKLYNYIHSALTEQTDTKAQYYAICNTLFQYQQEYPFYFDIVQKEINVDFEKPDSLQVEKETFHIGEEIIEKLAQFLQAGITAGKIRSDISIMSTVFSFWAMLCGLVSMSAKKEIYIKKKLNLSRQDFLNYGFDTLYRSISTEEVLS